MIYLVNRFLDSFNNQKDFSNGYKLKSFLHKIAVLVIAVLVFKYLL